MKAMAFFRQALFSYRLVAQTIIACLLVSSLMPAAHADRIKDIADIAGQRPNQ